MDTISKMGLFLLGALILFGNVFLTVVIVVKKQFSEEIRFTGEELVLGGPILWASILLGHLLKLAVDKLFPPPEEPFYWD